MKKRVEFNCGELSLEGILSIPEGSRPLPAIIICHPHPLYGGSMNNNVVNRLFETLVGASFISLKFNFRGVGRSQGKFSYGIGEQKDVEAAITFINALREIDSKRIGLAGYSAGAAFALPVAVADTRIKALAVISPPFSMFDFDLLKSCLKPKLLICGNKDNFTPIDHFLEFDQNLPEPREHHVIEGADHFWGGYESVLAAKVAAFFADVLKSY